MIQQFVPVQVDAGHCLVGFLGERLSNVKRFFCIIAIHPHQNQGKLVGLILYVSGWEEPVEYEGRRRKSRPSLPLPGVGPSAVGGTGWAWHRRLGATLGRLVLRRCCLKMRQSRVPWPPGRLKMMQARVPPTLGCLKMRRPTLPRTLGRLKMRRHRLKMRRPRVAGTLACLKFRRRCLKFRRRRLIMRQHRLKMRRWRVGRTLRRSTITPPPGRRPGRVQAASSTLAGLLRRTLERMLSCSGATLSALPYFLSRS